MATKNYIPVVPEEVDYKLAFPATEEPQPNGEPTPGVSEKFAREDHVHPLIPQDEKIILDAIDAIDSKFATLENKINSIQPNYAPELENLQDKDKFIPCTTIMGEDGKLYIYAPNTDDAIDNKLATLENKINSIQPNYALELPANIQYVIDALYSELLNLIS